MDRRTFAGFLGALAAAAITRNATAAEPGQRPVTDKQPAATNAEGPAAGAPRPFQIGMIMFDNMTNLDLVGPADMFSRVREAKVHLISATTEPVKTDSGMRVLPTMTMAEAPQLDLFCVPGGPGTVVAMEDPAMLAFLQKQAAGATWITSVCTGALVLGAAGLLKGYKAATHWTCMDLLPFLGAEPVHERVVIDRNRITGGGVTAGIDFGLTVIGRIWGVEQAQLIQLGNEYDPAPPFNAGSPSKAPPAIVERFRTLTARLYAARSEAAKRVKARLG